MESKNQLSARVADWQRRNNPQLYEEASPFPSWPIPEETPTSLANMPEDTESQSGVSQSHQISGGLRGIKRKRSSSSTSEPPYTKSEIAEMDFQEQIAAGFALLSDLVIKIQRRLNGQQDQIDALVRNQIQAQSTPSDRQRAIRVIEDFARAEGWDTKKCCRALRLIRDEAKVDMIVTLSPEILKQWLSYEVPSENEKEVEKQ